MVSTLSNPYVNVEICTFNPQNTDMMLPNNEMTRAELEMVHNFNEMFDLIPPIDLSLPDEALSEAISNEILKNIPPEAFKSKKGEPLSSTEIALENRLQQADGVGPDVFPDDLGNIDLDLN